MELERQVRVSDIVNLSEAARRLGVSASLVHQWGHRYADFPAPLTSIARQRIYAYSDILGWLERRRPYGRVACLKSAK